MKAWVVHRPGPIDTGPLAFVDRAPPEPRPGEVRVRVVVCGVCRTDLHLAEGDLSPHAAEVVPGHEIVGIVDGLGPGTSRFAVGDRIGIAWLRHTCGACRFCSRGDVRSAAGACSAFAKHAHLQPLVDALVRFVEEIGPFDVEVAKTRISFTGRTRFAGVARLRRDGLVVGFWLKRRIRSSRLARAEHLERRDWVYQVVVRTVDDLDDDLRPWLEEAYRVGQQEA